MKAYTYTTGRTHLVRFPTDADMYDEITNYVRSNDIQAAHVTGLGAVQRAALRAYDQETKVYEDFVIDEHLELLAAVGNVSLLDGEPFLHMHVAVGTMDGAAHGGHLNVGTPVFALEVAITELEGDPPVRALDDCTGLMLWGGTIEDC